MKVNLVIDFDSTMVQVETLDELARVALDEAENKESILEEIKRITALGMEGKIPFSQSLSKRLSLINLDKKHVRQFSENIVSQISDSFLKNKNFFLENGAQIFIVSGGFRETIRPVADFFHIPGKNVLANDFVYEKEKIIGVDEKNWLSMSGGKVKAIQKLNLPGKKIVVGDGFTDYQIKEAGAADFFVAFTENVFRKNVVEAADFEAKCFEEVIDFWKKSL